MDKSQTSVTGYWWHLSQLANIIKHESRFIIPEPYLSFVNSIIQLTRDKFSSIIPANSKLYRARINSINFENRDNEKLPLPPEQMGAPPSHIATPGRINPEGIPYLYCAGEVDTAGSELRPWKGAFLTIADILIDCDLPVVDLTIDCNDSDSALMLFFDDFTDMFSTQWPPESKLNFLVTQFFSEHFISVGFRGIKYKSDFYLGGNNYALFFKEDYTIDKTYVVETSDLSYFFFNKNETV